MNSGKKETRVKFHSDIRRKMKKHTMEKKTNRQNECQTESRFG